VVTAPSSLSASLTSALPTIGIVAGVGLVALLFLRAGSGSSSGGRRRNPFGELILMGANPHRYRRGRR